MKKRIIICGYPKSGNTWLTRLTAEILNCPVVGFWCQPFNKEEAIEGNDRKSDYQCFKAHHSCEQLRHTLNLYGNGTEKVIYIYRDPRAVAVSAFHYFNFSPRYPRIHSILAGLPFGLRLYYKFLNTSAYEMGLIAKGLVHGTNEGAFLREPWARHVKGFMNRSDTLLLSYESLKDNPLRTTERISEFLALNRSKEELEKAIEAQSFERKKRKFEKEGRENKAAFMRKGAATAWKSELPLSQIAYIEQNLAQTMTELGYALETNVEIDGGKRAGLEDVCTSTGKSQNPQFEDKGLRPGD